LRFGVSRQGQLSKGSTSACSFKKHVMAMGLLTKTQKVNVGQGAPKGFF
jgi:hypothetical protein